MGAEFFQGEIHRLGIGGILSPEPWASSGISRILNSGIGRVLSLGIGEFSELGNELRLLTL